MGKIFTISRGEEDQTTVARGEGEGREETQPTHNTHKALSCPCPSSKQRIFHSTHGTKTKLDNSRERI